MHMWNMTHSIYGTWLNHMWDMTHSYVGHDSFTCVTHHTYEWLTSHIWTSYVTDTNDSSTSSSCNWECNIKATVCCSLLQCVAVCCSLLQSVAFQPVAVFCSVLQCVAACCNVLAVCLRFWRVQVHRRSKRRCFSLMPSMMLRPRCVAVCCCSVLQCVAVCCSVLQYVAVLCSALQCFKVGTLLLFDAFYNAETKVCCSVMQCIAECCSVLQCNAV